MILVFTFLWIIFEPSIYLSTFTTLIAYSYKKISILQDKFSFILLILSSSFLFLFIGLILNYTKDILPQQIIETQYFNVEAGIFYEYVNGVFLLLLVSWIFYFRYFKRKLNQNQYLKQVIPIILITVNLIYGLIVLKFTFINSSNIKILTNSSSILDMAITIGAVIILLFQLSSYAEKRNDIFNLEPKHRSGLKKFLPRNPIHPYFYILLIYPVSIF